MTILFYCYRKQLWNLWGLHAGKMRIIRMKTWCAPSVFWRQMESTKEWCKVRAYIQPFHSNHPGRLNMVCARLFLFIILKSGKVNLILPYYFHFSCQNNSRFQIYHDRRIVLRALKDIPRGEEITTIYLSPLMGNVLR